jgi:hypothetical protein
MWQLYIDICFYVNYVVSTGRIQLYIKGFLIGGNWTVVEYPSWLWAYITQGVQQLCHFRNKCKAESVCRMKRITFGVMCKCDLNFVAFLTRFCLHEGSRKQRITLQFYEERTKENISLKDLTQLTFIILVKASWNAGETVVSWWNKMMRSWLFWFVLER